MSGARFPPRARLSHQTEFRRVFERPIRSGDAFFTLLARPNNRSFPRLGLAVSRKTAKSAVVRNRIKRIVRESFRHQQQRLGGVDVVVIGKREGAMAENAALFASLERHWARLARRCAGC